MEANIINDNFVHDSNYKRIYIKQNMDYEEKYKKTLEKARKELQACGSVDCDAAKQIFRFFPELAESDDEKIKKWIKKELESKYVVDNIVNNEMADKALAWLEKQGGITKLSEEEQNRFSKGVLTSCALSFIDYLDAHKYEGKMCVSNGECEDIENAFHNAMWNRLHRYYCKYIEKQGEQGKSALEAIKEHDICETCERQAGCIEECPVKLVEKQEPADKVEPKFHEGDWLVNIEYGNVVRVLEVLKNNYRLDFGGDTIGTLCTELVDNDYRLWDINKDANDGDVLATENFIFVFKNIDNGNGVHYYCHYEINKHKDCNQFGVALPQSLMGRVGNSISHYSPATKEQRDTLMKAVADAGYTFDFEKKELKEIEPDEWSEECCINQLIVFCENCMVQDTNAKRCANFLKSLKDRITWKPSDEQMLALDSTLQYSQVSHNSYENLNSLYNDLKKLTE